MQHSILQTSRHSLCMARIDEPSGETYNSHSYPIPHMKTLIALYLLAFACSATFASSPSPNAGIVAAREMGLTNYVEFKNNGKTDSAALFYWRGNWWVYHPSFGSMKTVLDNKNKVP